MIHKTNFFEQPGHNEKDKDEHTEPIEIIQEETYAVEPILDNRKRGQAYQLLT